VGFKVLKTSWIRESFVTKMKTQIKPTNMNMYLTNSSTVELTESEKISKTALGAYDIAALNQ